MKFDFKLPDFKDFKFTDKHKKWIGFGIGGLALLTLGKIYFNGGVSKSKQDLKGQVIIITGANTGIGKETAIALARQGATLVLACRDSSRTLPVVDEIKKLTNNQNIEFMFLDLSNLKSVMYFAEAFKAKYSQLNMLINNAGIMRLPIRKFTRDGYEMQFGVNHLGHFYLTNLLTDLLKKSAPSRVINVSSLAHTRGSMNFEDINLEKCYEAGPAYAQSKLANVLFTKEYAKLHKDDNIKAVALHPGVVRTELARHMMTGSFKFTVNFFRPLFWYVTKNSYQGAQTTIECALMPFEKLESGEYYADCKVAPVSENAKKEDDAKKLWDISEKLISDRFVDPYFKREQEVVEKKIEENNEQQEQQQQQQAEPESQGQAEENKPEQENEASGENKQEEGEQ